MDGYGMVILAAGGSSRLGQPKQLLHYQDKSLIQHIAQIAVDVVRSPVVAVLGAHAHLIGDQLERIPVHTVYNPDWTSGIASSIRKGLLTALEFSPEMEAVIFTVCDQPHISADLILEMINARGGKNKSIVACTYDRTVGTPVLFSKQHFNELLQLHDHEGAKKIIHQDPG